MKVMMTSVEGKSFFSVGIDGQQLGTVLCKNDVIQTRFYALIKYWSQLKIWIVVLKMTWFM